METNREQMLDRFARLIVRHLPGAELGADAMSEQDLDTYNEAMELVHGEPGENWKRLIRIPADIHEETDADGNVVNSFVVRESFTTHEGSPEHLEYLKNKPYDHPYFNND
jgi:hypothetical protein